MRIFLRLASNEKEYVDMFAEEERTLHVYITEVKYLGWRKRAHQAFENL
jgi:hypothetical protein